MTNSRRNPRILSAIVFSLSLLLVVTYAVRLATKTALDKAISEQKVQIREEEQHVQTLKQYLAYVHSDAYVEEVARNELGLIQPGDEPIIIVAQPAEMAGATTAEVAPRASSSLLQQWLEKLGW